MNINHLDKEVSLFNFRNKLSNALIPYYDNFAQLLGYRIKLHTRNNVCLVLSKISAVHECEIDFINKTMTIFALGKEFTLDKMNKNEFVLSSGFKNEDVFWSFYSNYYKRDIINTVDSKLKFINLYF